MSKHAALIEQIEKMSVLDLAELVKVLEEKFGVSAAAPTAYGVGAPTPPPADVGEEKTAFAVHLVSAGEQKVQVIKVLKEALGLGLKEAKDMTDQVPILVKEGLKKEEAEDLKKKLEAAGAKAELK